MLPCYSFASVLLHCLLLLFSVRASSLLLCCPQHVDLSLMSTDQYHDVTHVCRIHHDTMTSPFEVVKHDVVQVDSLLKGYSVIILGVQILIIWPL